VFESPPVCGRCACDHFLFVGRPPLSWQRPHAGCIEIMAIAALRVALGELPPGTAHALAVALRPSPRATSQASHQPGMAAAALQVAAGWLPHGTPKAAALAAAKGLSQPGCRVPCPADAERSVAKTSTSLASSAGGADAVVPRAVWALRSTTAAAALAVAAQHQPHGTSEARELAVAAGSAFLRDLRGTTWQRNTPSAAAVALAVAMGRLGGDMAAALAAAVRRPASRVRGAPRAAPSNTGGDVAAANGGCPRLREVPRGTHTDAEAGTAAPARLVGAEGAPGDVFPHLCQDTSCRVIEQLWPSFTSEASVLTQRERSGPASRACNSMGSRASFGRFSAPGLLISPRTFESRLRQSMTILQDLQQVSAVSPVWARRADRDGWPATHAYLYQEPGTKSDLRERYCTSMRQLIVKDWLRQGFLGVHGRAAPAVAGGAESLASRIVAFMP